MTGENTAFGLNLEPDSSRADTDDKYIMLPDLLYILFASCVASGNGGPTLSDNPFYRVNSCVEDAFRNGDFRRRYPDIYNETGKHARWGITGCPIGFGIKAPSLLTSLDAR